MRGAKKRQNIKSRNSKRSIKNTDFSSSLLSIIFSALLIMVFTFHLFLSKQIDGLNADREQIEKESKQLDIEIDLEKNKFKQKFQDNRYKIANIFYGSSEDWKEYLPIGN